MNPPGSLRKRVSNAESVFMSWRLNALNIILVQSFWFKCVSKRRGYQTVAWMVKIIGFPPEILRFGQNGCTIVTQRWVRWRLKSSASRLFTQAFIQAQIKENIKAPRHWPLWGEVTGDRWISRTKGQYRGKCFHLMTLSWTYCSQRFQIRFLKENICILIQISLNFIPELQTDNKSSLIQVLACCRKGNNPFSEPMFV